MPAHRSPSLGDVIMEAAAATAGLGILTFALFPLNLAGIVLFLIGPLVLVVTPLLVVSIAVLLLAAPFVLLFRGARGLARRWKERGAPRTARGPEVSASCAA